ncbi:MAG TPA: protein kinase [Blastocatellia bacterium]|nr:protein kinase [Blastocatellia bacterium]
MVSQSISHYRIIRRIGVGGMGEVYLAEDTRLGRKVALKVLPAEFTKDESRLRRFEQEARAASALNHPGILTVFEVGHSEDIHFIATEYIEGKTLRQYSAETPIDLHTALDVSIQVANALSAAHHAGIAHRDIKPENIMLRDDGYVKVLDFGLAKLSEPINQSSDPEAATLAKLNTEPGTVLGTVTYMSPEQARGLDVDGRSDIFSLGIVLYEMIAGRPPFQGATPTDLIVAMVTEEPAPLADHAPGVPVDLERIVAKSMAKDRAARYQTAKDLLADLKRLKQRLEVQAEIERSYPSGIAGQTTGESPKPLPSIAVLPFVNMSADAENEYFCEGLAEDLINALAKLDGLRVAARTSAFSFKGKDADVRVIGSKLNVSTVLEGSVRKAGQRLRISAQLINVADGYHIWSERYDRQMEDIFDIQDEISLAITDVLKVKLLDAEKVSLLRRRTDNPEAYQIYLLGRYYLNKYTEEGGKKAVEYFEQAIAIEPEYALAYSGLADAYRRLWFFGFLRPDEAVPHWRAATAKAIELDPGLAAAHVSMGSIKSLHDWDWEGAEEEFKLGIKLNPQSPLAHETYGYALISTGRADEAIAAFYRALEMDPLSLPLNMNLGFIFSYANQYDRAIEQGHRVIALEPQFHGGYTVIGYALSGKEMYAEAQEYLRKSIALGGGAMALNILTFTNGRLGKLDEARAGLAKLLEIKKQKFIPAYFLAALYSALDDADKVFEWLEKAYEERNGFLTFINCEHAFERFHSDPRYKDLVRRIGLPEAR